jgi:hypothetical protein
VCPRGTNLSITLEAARVGEAASRPPPGSARLMAARSPAPSAPTTTSGKPDRERRAAEEKASGHGSRLGRQIATGQETRGRRIGD